MICHSASSCISKQCLVGIASAFFPWDGVNDSIAFADVCAFFQAFLSTNVESSMHYCVLKVEIFLEELFCREVNMYHIAGFPVFHYVNTVVKRKSKQKTNVFLLVLMWSGGIFLFQELIKNGHLGIYLFFTIIVLWYKISHRMFFIKTVSTRTPKINEIWEIQPYLYIPVNSHCLKSTINAYI